MNPWPAYSDNIYFFTNYLSNIVGSILDIRLGRKKMTESKTMPPRQNVIVPTRERVYNSSATMPPTRFPPSNKLELQNGEHYTSDIQNGEIQEEDAAYADKLTNFPYLVPASGILKTVSLPRPLSFFESFTNFCV